MSSMPTIAGPFGDGPLDDTILHPPAPAPIAMPNGPMPAATPAPAAIARPAAPGPFVQQPPANHAKWQDMLRMAIPAVIGAFGVKMAPQQTAAALGGAMRGIDRQRAVTEQAQETSQRKMKEGADFTARAIAELGQLDPSLHPAYIDYITHVGQQVYGLNPNDLKQTFTAMTAGATDAKARAGIASVLEANDKLYPGGNWSAPDPSGATDPQTGKVAVRPRDWFAQNSGRTSFLPPKEKVDIPNTAEEQFYATYAKEHGAKTYGDLPTAQQREARQQWQTTNGDTNKGVGTFEDYVVRYASEKGVDPKKLTTAQIEDARARFEKSGRAPAANGLLPAPGDTSKTGEAYLATVPAEQRDMIRKIANYQMDIAKVTSLRGGERERIASMVAQFDPTFDMTAYAARQRTRNDFTSGKSAQNIKGINTAIGHLDALSSAFDGLDNGSYHVVNAAENAMANNLPLTAGLKTRQGAMTKLKTDFNAVKGELAGIFKSSGATDSEIRSWDATLADPTTATPAERKAFVEATTGLMGSRMNALRQQYEVGLGKPADFAMLSPESRKILTKLGMDANQLDPGFGDAPTPGDAPDAPAVEVWVRDANGKLVKKAK